MRPELNEAAELLKQNTPEAVERAMALLQRTVYSFSMKVCGHPEDAEDTMQEVLYRAMPHLTRIVEPRALAVWLYTVTRNRCWRMRRKPAGAPEKMVPLDELMPDDAELGRLLVDVAANPEADVARSEGQELLMRAVQEIPLSLRLVLVLHDMEDLTTDEVAQVLGLKTGTVRVRLHRARLATRKAVQELTDRAVGRKAKDAKKSSGAKKRSVACRELFAELSEYLDGNVEPKTCEEMRAHIESCPACVAFLRELRGTIDRCRTADVACDEKVLERLRSALTREYMRLMTQPPKMNGPAV
jgi:RNA polymerase sigma-70 factor (ECF subfamily)